MIYLYSGTPGSGKSLDTARVILNTIRVKKPIICNFSINVPAKMQDKSKYFHFWSNDELSVDRLVAFSRDYFSNHKFKEGAITLVIDEAQLLFNSREWNKKGRDYWLKFFTNHRHLGFDVILVAQFDLMIDKQIRSLIEYEVIHRKVSNFGFKGYILMLFFLAPVLFCRVKVWYPMKIKVDSTYYRYKPIYGKTYDTFDTIFLDNDFVFDDKGVN